MNETDGKRFGRASLAALSCGLGLLGTLLAVMRGRFIFAGFSGLLALAMGGVFLAVRAEDVPRPTTPGPHSKLASQRGFWQMSALTLGVSLVAIFLLLLAAGALPGNGDPSPIFSYIGAAGGGWLAWKGWGRVIHMARTKGES